MQSGWRIGSIFGIPLHIAPSWLLVVVLMTTLRGAGWQQQYPAWGNVTAYAAGLTMAVLLFASVLLHELGHSLVARAQGIKVNSITLFLFGGVAAIEQESKTPGQAFQVAIAGPAVSFALFLILRLVYHFLPGTLNPAAVLTYELAALNLVLGVFNLLPGLPLDGGQVVKAFVWKLTGSRFKGIRWATRAGRALGWSAVIFGVFAGLQVGIGGWWIAMLGYFGLQNANNYDRVANLQETILKIKAGDAMTREFRVVDANLSLHQFANEYMQATTPPPALYAASDGRYRGLVIPEEMRDIERSQWELETVYRLTHPLADIPAAEEVTPLVDVILLLEDKNLRRVTVLSPAGAVSGVIDRGDIVQAIAQRMGIKVPPDVIRRIKDEGNYPPSFNVIAIAQGAKDAAEATP